MTKEQQLVLALCSMEPNSDVIIPLLEHPLDFPYVLGQLLYNRVGGIAYHNLKQLGLLGRINREFRNSLQCVWQANAGRAESMRQALCQLGEWLADLPVPYAVLKGALLVELYPLGLRSSNDVDFLIQPKDVAALSERLKQLDFVQGHIRNGEFTPASRLEIISSRVNRGETVPFVKQIDLPQMPFLEIDINFSLSDRPGDDDLVHRFVSRCDRKTPHGLSTLCENDFFIHLCAHLYKEAVQGAWVMMGRDQSLYKYVDIQLLMQSFTPDAMLTLAADILASGLQKACCYTVSRTRELFDVRSAAVDALLDAITPADTRFLNEVYLPDDVTTRFDVPFVDWIFHHNRKELLQ